MGLCERCHKEQATVHLTEIRGQQKQEVHLCQACAESQGVVVKQHLDISNLIAGIAAGEQRARGRAAARKACPSCGHALGDFQQTGRLGCPEDYTVFREELGGLLKRMHDALQHAGKAPARAASAVRRVSEQQRLEAELRQAVAREDYEAAARLRDQLRGLQEPGDAP